MKKRMKIQSFFRNGIPFTEEYAKDIELMKEVELEVIRLEMKKMGIIGGDDI